MMLKTPKEHKNNHLIYSDTQSNAIHPLVSNLILLAIIILSFCVRMFYIFDLSQNPLPSLVASSDIFDQFRFMSLANEFYSGNWLGSEVMKYSPAYSYLIAALFTIFGKNMYFVFVFQAILGCFAIFIIYKTSTLLFNNKVIGLISAMIIAFYGPFVFYDGTLLRASLIAYLNLIGFYCLLYGLKHDQKKYYILAGLSIGFSMILRPNLLPLVIIPYIVLTLQYPFKKKCLYALLFVLGLMIFITPLSIRNKALKKDVLISYQGPSTFWIGNTYNSTGMGLPRRALRNQLANEAQGSIMKTIQILTREIKTHPQAYLRLYTVKILAFFSGYEIPANLNYNQFWEVFKILQYCPFDFNLIGPLSLIGIFLVFNKFRNIPLLLLFVGVLSFSVIAFHVQGRYRIPSIPFYIILASYGLHWFCLNFIQHNFKNFLWGVLITLLLYFAAFCVHPFIAFRFNTIRLSSDHANMMAAYYGLAQNPPRSISEEEKKYILQKAIFYSDKSFDVLSAKHLLNRVNRLVQTAKLYQELDNVSQAQNYILRAIKLAPQFHKQILEVYNDDYDKATGMNWKKMSFSDAFEFYHLFRRDNYFLK